MRTTVNETSQRWTSAHRRQRYGLLMRRSCGRGLRGGRTREAGKLLPRVQHDSKGQNAPWRIKNARKIPLGNSLWELLQKKRPKIFEDAVRTFLLYIETFKLRRLCEEKKKMERSREHARTLRKKENALARSVNLPRAKKHSNNNRISRENMLYMHARTGRYGKIKFYYFPRRWEEEMKRKRATQQRHSR